MVWLEIELKSFRSVARFDLSYELYVFKSGMSVKREKTNGFRSFWEFAIKKYCMYSTNARSEADVSPRPHIEFGMNLKHRLLMTSISSRMMLERYHKSMHNVYIWANISFQRNEFRCGESNRKQVLEYFPREMDECQQL